MLLKNTHLSDWLFTGEQLNEFRTKRLAVLEEIQKRALMHSVIKHSEREDFSAEDEEALMALYCRSLVSLVEKVFKSTHLQVD